jgi:transposase
MSQKRIEVHLTEVERDVLEKFVAQGKKSARAINRARILLLADEGRNATEIANILGISRGTVYNVRKQYNQQEQEHILDCLHEKPRRGRPIKIDTRVEANVTMIACSEPPEGSARWTLHMIADKLVQLEVTDSISHESVRRALKKNKLKPWLSEQWCIGNITGDYLWRMEDVLYQYALPYDPLRPLICFDERPCFLIGDVGSILPMSVGKAKRYHYEYEKQGSCCVFLAFEPHTGFRYVEVRARRTAVDYAQFMQNLIQKHYAHVDYIRLVQDNLNTHTPGSFFEVLSAMEAFELSQRFEPHYTPTKGSWLNMAEIEFAALSKQCLDRRIPAFDRLRQEVVAWAGRRNLERKTVNWTFSQKDARNKLQRHYQNVQKLS